MNRIEVAVLNEASVNPAGMQLFLAKLTQRGHDISNMNALMHLYNSCIYPSQPRTSENIQTLAVMPHGTIKRFAPITIAIVGASRRFLAQARTNQVGIDYLSGSLQYSDYSNNAQFVVPYEMIAKDAEVAKRFEGVKNINPALKTINVDRYLASCNSSISTYKELASSVGNDAAGYAAPQGLRNILIMQGNHQSWDYFIRLRTCNRNTLETQYVALKIWEELLSTTDGEDLFAFAGADCVHGKCREGKMCCGKVLLDNNAKDYANKYDVTVPHAIIETKFPLLRSM